MRGSASCPWGRGYEEVGGAWAGGPEPLLPCFRRQGACVIFGPWPGAAPVGSRERLGGLSPPPGVGHPDACAPDFACPGSTAGPSLSARDGRGVQKRPGPRGFAPGNPARPASVAASVPGSSAPLLRRRRGEVRTPPHLVGKNGPGNGRGAERAGELGGGYHSCCLQPIVILGLDPRIGVARDGERSARTDPPIKSEDDEERQKEVHHKEHKGGTKGTKGAARGVKVMNDNLSLLPMGEGVARATDEGRRRVSANAVAGPVRRLTPKEAESPSPPTPSPNGEET